MQKFKNNFVDSCYSTTFTNIQSCIRLKDLDEIDDGNHLLLFNMIGFFSFREWSVKETISFWMDFLIRLDIIVDTITVHPDKYDEWSQYYKPFPGCIVIKDTECIWSDGKIGGYCTEFFVNGLEIGNIVNTNGDCIDVGFGLERLEMVLDGKHYTKQEVLSNTINSLINSYVQPSNKMHGYVLRKLLRLCIKYGYVINHEYYTLEQIKVMKIHERYIRLKDKHKDKSSEWWYDTHGIDVTEYKSIDN